MTIDPSTCKARDLYVVQAQYTDVAENYGMRVNKGLHPWAILGGSSHDDDEVTVVRRADQQFTADGEALAQLVRDVRDAPDQGHTVQIDGVLIAKCDTHGRIAAHHAQPLTDWETLRRAADLVARDSKPYAANKCLLLADRLEAEHNAAQEKAAADARREKAVAAMTDAYNEADGHFNLFELAYDALADAGYIAEVES